MANNPVGSSSLTPFEVPGRYEDSNGREDITWRVVPTARRVPPGQSGFELRTSIRGVEYWGYDFDGLSTDDERAARAAGLPVDLYEKGTPGWILEAISHARWNAKAPGSPP